MKKTQIEPLQLHSISSLLEILGARNSFHQEILRQSLSSLQDNLDKLQIWTILGAVFCQDSLQDKTNSNSIHLKEHSDFHIEKLVRKPIESSFEDTGPTEIKGIEKTYSSKNS